MFERPRDYCLRQVMKICFYVQTIYHMEIIKLNADFYQDDNEQIWFVCADDILVRPMFKSKKDRLTEN